MHRCIGVMALLLAACGGSSNGAGTFTTTMNGANEAPAVTTSGTGTASAASARPGEGPREQPCGGAAGRGNLPWAARSRRKDARAAVSWTDAPAARRPQVAHLRGGAVPTPGVRAQAGAPGALLLPRT